MEKIRVLIADNSGFVRLVMSDILNNEKDIAVVDTALDGDELLDKANALRPDVIIADIDIPKNYNLFALKRIPADILKRVILTGKEERLKQALIDEVKGLGIRNFLIKPDNLFQSQLRLTGKEIIKKVRSTAAGLTARNISFSDLLKSGMLASARAAEKAEYESGKNVGMQVVVIGASTGGPAIIEKILSAFEEDLPACILVAQHLPASFTGVFALRLSKATKLQVSIGEKNMPLLPGKVIIAPGNLNMIIKKSRKEADKAFIDFSESVLPVHDTPSIDLLMESVAKIYRQNVLGVILSGLGRDGTAGAGIIKNYGGEVIAQDVGSAIAYGMAKSAIEGGVVNKIFPPDAIAYNIKRHLKLGSLRLNASINI